MAKEPQGCIQIIDTDETERWKSGGADRDRTGNLLTAERLRGPQSREPLPGIINFREAGISCIQ